MRFDRTLDVARRKLGVGDDHHWLESRRIGADFLMTLAQHSGAYSRGPRKGQPKFSRESKKQVMVACGEADAEVTAYELRTGLCSDCEGSGKEVTGWSAANGNRYATCTRCKGDGKSRLTGASEPVPAAPPAGPGPVSGPVPGRVRD